MSRSEAKVSSTAFFTFPEGSTFEGDHVILPDGRAIVPIMGFMCQTGDLTANASELEQQFGVELVEYMDGGDTIDEVPF
jgi:hypothetical protein